MNIGQINYCKLTKDGVTAYTFPKFKFLLDRNMIRCRHDEKIRFIWIFILDFIAIQFHMVRFDWQNLEKFIVSAERKLIGL